MVRSDAATTEGPEGRILRAILDGSWACATVASLLKAGGEGERRVAAARALEALVVAGLVVRWTAPNGWRLATLTPLGAERLDRALIQPAEDEDPEPRWGAAGIGDGGPFDQTGRYADEPDHFVIDEEWGEMTAAGIRRSRTRFERIAMARAAKGRSAVEVLIDRETGAEVVLWWRTVPIDKRLRKGRRAG